MAKAGKPHFFGKNIYKIPEVSKIDKFRYFANPVTHTDKTGQKWQLFVMQFFLNICDN